MAEAFGIAAGVLTVIDLSVKVISKCKHLIETTHDAPKDLRQIFIEISSLKATLESLKFLSDTDTEFSDTLQSLGEVEGAVRGCHNTVEELAKELDGLAISRSSQAAQGKRQMLKGSLKWCLKESRARKLLDDAIRHKSTISLALIGEIAQDVKEIRSSVGKIRQDLNVTKQREICNWIERINPTRDHSSALKLRDDQTCRWFLKQQEWDDWVHGKHRLIWIHGIPGAGKTILASYIIEQTTAKHSSRQVTNTCLYFYCSYRHGGDQTTSFLRWIVSQLCRQLNRIPTEISELHHRNTELTVTQLTNALATLLGEIGLVYVVVDAVDECNTKSDIQAADAPGMRVEFLQVLQTLLTRPEFAKIKIIATSRNYIDIEEILRPLAAPVSMSNPLVDEDIRTYVRTEIRTNKHLKRWPQPLLQEIEGALVEGAKGMFRWASCQIFILQRKRSESDLRKALKELPEDLDETYARILSDIPNADWAYARSALLWICAHDSLGFRSMGIPANCLVSAVFSPKATDTHLYTIATLQEICGCLIRTSSFGPDDGKNEKHESFETFALAHYTVKEFLYSRRIENTSISYFHSSEEDTTREILTTALGVCSTLDLRKKPDYFFQDFHNYCREIGRLATSYWQDILLNDDKLFSLQIEYLDNPEFEPPEDVFNGLFHDDDYNRDLYWDVTPHSFASRQSLILLKLLQANAPHLCIKFLQDLDFQIIFSAPIDVYGNSPNDNITTLTMVLIGLLHWIGPPTYPFFLQLCKERLDWETWLTVYKEVPADFRSCKEHIENGIECPPSCGMVRVESFCFGE